MASKSKSGVKSDVQIKPIFQRDDQVSETKIEPAENSLVHTENKALLEKKLIMAKQTSLGASEVVKITKEDVQANKDTGRGEVSQKEQGQCQSSTNGETEAKADQTFEEILESENEGVKPLRNFNLAQTRGINFPGTIIDDDNLIIISDNQGSTKIYSKKHDKELNFGGAGGTRCFQIKVQDNILYQSCFEGKQGIFYFKLDQEALERQF